MNPLIQYSVLRVALFAGLFTLLLLVGVDWLIAALIAAVVGLCISYIFLRQQREAVVGSLSGRTRAARRDADEDEDDALDRAEQ